MPFFKFVIVLLVAFVAACGGTGIDADVPDNTTPRVTMLETSELVVGQPLNFYGDNFLVPSEGRTKLTFAGIFLWDDGSGQVLKEKVLPFTIAPLYDGMYSKDVYINGVSVSAGTKVLRLNRFGPFNVMFSSQGNKAGTFKGTVQATNHYNDGRVVADPMPTEVTIEVKPSIIINILEPVIGKNPDGTLKTAGCGSPALRALAGLPYLIEVEAVGFVPDYFLYRLSGVNGDVSGWKEFTHTADPSKDGRDRLGDPNWHPDEIVVFNQVSDDAEFNIAAIQITAVDTNNVSYSTALPISVVRPLQFYYDGNRELAEYYEPVEVYGPIPGAIATRVVYQEQASESRQKAVSVSISKSWTQSNSKSNTNGWSEGISNTVTKSTANSVGISHSEGESSSETYGASYSSSEANSVSFSSQKGSNWGWNLIEGQSEEEFASTSGEIYGEASVAVNTSVTGEGSVPGFAKVSGTVGTTVGAKLGGKKGSQEGAKVGSKTDYGTHMYGSENETEAFGSVTTDSKSESMSGTYGLSKQSTINNQTTETEANSESTTFSTSGSFGITEGITEGSQETWSETWTDSTTFTKSLSLSSIIPNGGCAMIYRQTTRYVRQAFLYSYDLCGVRSLAGEMFFNEWTWSPDIQIGAKCNEQKPPSKLPAAACYIACGN